MKRNIFGHWLGAVALLVGALLVARADVRAALQEENKEVSNLLDDIKWQAADLDRDSEELESFTRSNASWESHADELNRIRDHINAIGKTLSRLQELRSSAAPWQQEAIDRITPLAQKLASSTTAAIEHLNKNPLRINDPRYQEYIKSNAEAASELDALVRDFVAYGKTRTTLEAYERKLEIAR
jgi:predicted nuclease with TOPRIM domain